MNLDQAKTLTKGQPVTLGPNCTHQYAKNAAATVVRFVKSRRVVTVELKSGDKSGQYYDAMPANVEATA